MTGELWRSRVQIGLETVAGTPVAATRKMYFGPDARLSREREGRFHRFATGTRDNVRAFTSGPQVAGGSLPMPLSASELIELLLMGIKGGVAPSTPALGVYLWEFVPGDTALDPATLEWYDGARGVRAAGCYVNSLTFDGSANGENLVTAELFAHGVDLSAITGGLPERVPDFIEGWETRFFLDAHAGTPGATNIAATLINWNVVISNNLGRKYFADNSNALGAVTTGELAVTAKLTIEASAAQAVTEYANWDAEALRLVRLEFGQNEVISGTLKRLVSLDIPGAWSVFDLGGTDEGTRVYELEMGYVYDPTNAFGLQIRCQNDRAQAWDTGS